MSFTLVLVPLLAWSWTSGAALVRDVQVRPPAALQGGQVLPSVQRAFDPSRPAAEKVQPQRQPRFDLAKSVRSPNPTLECGLVVWHVDEKMDPKFVLSHEPWNLDPKIHLKPFGPCGQSK